MWWFLGAAVMVIVARHLWRTYNHPAAVLGRQAANMGWIAIGNVKDPEGYRDVQVAREGASARISFRKGNVEVNSPWGSATCRDFVEVERWLVTAKSEHQGEHRGASQDDDTEETRYYQAVEQYIKDLGQYQRVLESQGTDEEFCIASLEVYKAGFKAGSSVKVVGALVRDAAHKHRTNRDFGIAFLQSVRKQLETQARQAASPLPQHVVDGNG